MADPMPNADHNLGALSIAIAAKLRLYSMLAGILFCTVVFAGLGIGRAEEIKVRGVSPTEIELGQTAPLSGPLSLYATFSRATSAYFAMVNERGGIHGRKVKLITLDDGFSPAKTVEQTRKLVESDGVFAMFAPIGTATNLATQKYLNDHHVPQVLVQSGIAHWNNPKEYPWSLPGIPNYEQEARIYGRYILDHLPASKVAVLYQADDYGRSYLDGLKAGLGTKARDMIVATQSFQVADPTVDSQILNLAASKADVLLIAATSKQTIQTLKKANELKWRPQLFIAYPAASPERTYALAGKETAKGAISVTVFKDPEDPDTIGDTDIKDYFSFMKKYYPEGNKNETLNVVAYVEAGIMTEMLKQAGPNLTSDSFLKAMSHFTAEHIPGLRKGVMVRTSPDNYNLYPRPLMMRFDGERNVIMKEQK